MKICLNCNLEYDNKFAFCHRCGRKLQEKIKQNYCPYCGNKIETDGEYCPFCGELLIDAEPKPCISSSALEYDVSLKTAVQSNFAISTKQSSAQKLVMSQIKSKYANDDADNTSRIEEESTTKSVLKLILYIVGAFILFFIIKVIGKGIATAAISNGYGVHFFILCLILIPVGMYLRNKY